MRKSSRRGQVALLCVTAGALAAPALALADTSPPPPSPPSTPSIDQYVETVPTSSGGTSAGFSAVHSKLPQRVAHDLREQRGSRKQQGAVSQQLRNIATSSAYGAPQHKLSRAPRGRTTKAGPVKPPSTPANPFSAAVGAVSGSSDNHVFWLLAAMIVVTTAMVLAAARRHAR